MLVDQYDRGHGSRDDHCASYAGQNIDDRRDAII